ncbi:MAG: 3-methyl-2-oxobutanoate hydroxymethyltransferase [Verrucomicrobia bacterium]|jgi:3-methyl-2-oxobutanoate hydroxymethyltransferase|nr:3-methyl-2-oxobutanoate hydroxymethyltransferase [Verrucomicrobiota bacterium]MBT5620739.1 3-methyl-2-oxobutanoate hydroxymethyltransferase [Verrucomicrobiota bacterium]MBT6104184.1 3-methyl-2-oxobutanoate hydroxymethyltransferase [Verrucomicrobiota bacterium]MBT6658752.1 3-methyl-2-oxobutanoate hydroxymethyltransferase [Verrucomicrobiota bacterium]MBT6790600.1 3-methyl-2-oxobutanoate hydroxymethyltransferase [Verrucomicrobiota bacterium]
MTPAEFALERGLDRGEPCRLSETRETPQTILQRKDREPIAALTAYDFPMAKLLDAAGVPLLLVGDSLGMVVLGYPDTTHVTLDEMAHHVRAVARAKPRGLIAADLPFETYETPQQAVESAKRLVAAGAEAVKAEGGQAILPQIEAIRAAGIPFLGHLGMLPQQVLEEGGYRIKGRDEAQREALLADAWALGQAGAFGIVLELVTPSVAAEITAEINIPTIGIGSGGDCDGQILVTTDLLGTSTDFIPKHVRPDELLRERMVGIIRGWRETLPKPSATRE